MPRLFRTTAFRLSLLYATLFSVISAVALGFVFWSTSQHIDEQVDARLRLEADVLLKLFQSRELPGLLETIRQRNREDSAGTHVYLLSGPDSGMLAGPLAGWPVFLDASRTYATFTREQLFGDQESAASDELIRVLVTRLPGGYRMLVGRSVEDEALLQKHTYRIVVLATAGIAGLGLLGGALMGWYVLRRIDGVSETAHRIIRGDLSQRLPTGNRNDEFDSLARRLNEMLDRIEQLLNGMKQVTDHVAHDLRIPLTRLRNRLEVTLLEARDEDEYRQVLNSALDDADGLIFTFNSLLNIARAEAGAKREDWDEVDLTALGHDLIELYEPLAEEKNMLIKTAIEPALKLKCVRTLVAQSLGNLLDNAIKYTPEQGTIELNMRTHDGVIEIEVADSGEGIPEEFRKKVLERFSRLDVSRSTPGNGLGLSLVKAMTVAHKADMKLEDNNPGLKVRLTFSV